MRRQIFLGRVILVAFFLYTVWLPLNHSCFDTIASSLTRQARQASASAGSFDVFTAHGFPAWMSATHISGRDRPCLACLWSHSLHKRVIEDIGVPQLIASGATRAESFFAASAEPGDAAPQRGPPLPTA